MLAQARLRGPGGLCGSFPESSLALLNLERIVRQSAGPKLANDSVSNEW
jgi:hypothetical protein